MTDLCNLLAASFAVPPHALGESFVPADDEERDAQLLVYADMICARYGVEYPDLGDEVGDAHYRRWYRELEAMMRSHDRYEADRQRRRDAYGYGFLGRLREWWGKCDA